MRRTSTVAALQMERGSQEGRKLGDPASHRSAVFAIGGSKTLAQLIQDALATPVPRGSVPKQNSFKCP